MANICSWGTRFTIVPVLVCVTKIINSVNPLYLGISRVNGYIEEKGVNKYLVFDSTDENKELLKKYNDVFNEIKDKIKKNR